MAASSFLLFAFHLRVATVLPDYQCVNEWRVHSDNLLYLLLSSQGYWVFFVVEGNGPLSSIYKALQIIDFYLGFVLPCYPIFGMDVSISSESFWIGSRKNLADMLNLVLCLTASFPVFLSMHWPVHGVDEGGGKHQTAQLDCPWNCRHWGSHLCSHGKTLDGQFDSYPNNIWLFLRNVRLWWTFCNLPRRNMTVFGEFKWENAVHSFLPSTNLSTGHPHGV